MSSRCFMREPPIHHIKIRVKSLDSITAKLRKKEFPVSIGSAMKNINDIAGVRVVCNYIDATCNNRTKNIKAQKVLERPRKSIVK